MNIRALIQNYIWVLNLFLLAGVCYFAAGALNSYVIASIIEPSDIYQSTKVDRQCQGDIGQAPKPAINRITSRDLFQVNSMETPTISVNEEFADELCRTFLEKRDPQAVLFSNVFAPGAPLGLRANAEGSLPRPSALLGRDHG